MSITVTPINTATDTFATWVTQTNTVIDIISSNTVTVDATVGGSATTGNAALTGDMSISGNTVVTNLRGGSLATPGAFSITTNVTATANLTVSGNRLTISGAGGLHVTTGGATISGAINLTDGNILQDRGGDAASANFTTNTDINQSSYFVYKVNNIDRWAIGRQAVGNNYQINRYNTAGVFQDVPLEIEDTTGLVSLANGLNVSAGITSLAANLDLNGTSRILLDADGDTYIYASADDTVQFFTGTAARLVLNNSLADFQATPIRTGGDITLDTDAADIRIGVGTTNVVANSSQVTLQNSTVTWTLTKPTASQVTAGNYYLASDNTWKEAGASRSTLQINGSSAAGEIYSFLKSSFRSAEVIASVRNMNANAYQISRGLVIHAGDNTNADYNEYSIVSTNTVVGTLSANSNTTHVRVYFTNASGTANSVVQSAVDVFAV